MKGALLVLLAAGCVIPHPPPAPPRQAHLALQMSSSMLGNGLRVVLVQDPRATEVQVTMRYEVGAADEPDDQLGVAHLVEHLMFQQVLGSKSLFATLEDIASSFNAFTDYDTTTYLERADKSQLDRLLSIEAVRMGFRCTTITDSVFEREREVVANELKQRGPSIEIQRSVYAGLYPEGHPYRRLLGGSPEGVGAITRQQACAFADAHYSPRNAVLVISGDITQLEVESALSKFIIKIADRPVVARAPVPPIKAIGHQLQITAPLDKELVLFAWPIATDPVMRARQYAIAPFIAGAIDGVVAGRVSPSLLGDERAPVVAVSIAPGEHETAAQVIEAAKNALVEIPRLLGTASMSEFGELSFHQLRQAGLFNLFASLDQTSATSANRDVRIAGYVIGGRDPRTALSDELGAVGTMSRAEAVDASGLFAASRAAVVVVRPDETAAKATEVVLTPPIHDLGTRRDPPDPAEAHVPGPPPTHGIPAAIQDRILPNGLHVVLAPISSVPTVELRLVFDAGTGDDPADARGTALVTARGLTWRTRYANDLLRFVAVGGTRSVEVGFDRTSFVAHGLDMHLDVLLAGLRRWVRDGEYEDAAGVTDRLRRITTTKTGDLDRTVTDAWRAAVYGDHAYRDAGLAHRIDAAVDQRDAERFRSERYVPDNATLIVSGGFDPAVADRWIDYLFADWAGHRIQRATVYARPRPASLAAVEQTSQVYLQIGMPATGSRLHQLVIAEMLDIVAGDLRHQLGATYGLGVQLSEARLASSYLFTGWIDRERLHDALALLDQRIHELATGGELAARTFVSARTHVATQLASIGNAADLAGRIEHEVAMGRRPLADLTQAADVERITLDQLALVDLDLARAAILMRGPESPITDAYTALDRTPTFVTATALPPLTSAPHEHERRSYSFEDFDEALTEPGPRHTFGFLVTAGPAIGQLDQNNTRGGQVAAGGMYWLRRNTAVGIQLGYSHFTGSFSDANGFTQIRHDTAVNAVRATAFAIATGYDRVWVAVFGGYHQDWVTIDGDTVTGTAPAIGGELGVDLFDFDRIRLGIYVHGDAAPFSDSNFGAVAFGLALRR